MAEKKAVRLQELLKRDRRVLKMLIDLGEAIIARNRESGNLRTISARALYQNNPNFYRVSGGKYDYLVAEEPLRRVLDTLKEIDEKRRKNGQRSEGEQSSSDERAKDEEAKTQSAGESDRVQAPLKGENRENRAPRDGEGRIDPQMPPNFGEEHDRILEMAPDERISLLERGKQMLKEIAANGGATAEELNEALVTTTSEAALINKTTIQEALRMGNEEAKRYTQEMVSLTQEMLRSTTVLVDNDLYNEELINKVVQRSNGTVVQHMTRVFLTGFAFMLYYNRQILTSSLANRIRINFNKTYKKLYQRLLPHLHEDYLSLEHVFYGGIKALSEVEINRFATGFLVHDVGKVEDIEYHEGEAGYDRETVVRHVKLGYKAVMDKTTYPREAALITGYHHEYYGDPSGYGYFREFLQAYKNMKPDAKIDYLMSYEMEPLIDYEVMAYFPAKMLEVVDVFDSVTDPNRLYRQPLSPREAIEMIQSQFVNEKLKIDPIILDLFKQFLTERGILT
ncbi:MAG: HD-GYP domain-containing protein [Alkalispirochaetaceae bacterium]